MIPIPQFSPKNSLAGVVAGLFQNNEPGVWYDPSDINLTWRRNLLTRSEEFDNAAWVKLNCTVVANATIAPDGALTADKLVKAIVATTAPLAQVVGTGVTGTYTKTVYAKKAEWSFLYLSLVNSSSTGVSFNLDTGEVTVIGTGPSGSAAHVGNGWYRCTITQTLTAQTLSAFVQSRPAATGSTTLGDGTSGVYIWGAQLELGSTATAYQKITDGVQDYFTHASSLPVLYQDAAGTTPVTAVEQPVGLMLDKSKGLVLGPELVTNGDFSGGTTGWSLTGTGASQAVSSGVLIVTRGSSATYSTSTITTVIGKTYRLSADVVSFTQQPVLRVSTTVGGSENYNVTYTSTGTKTAIFTATATTTYVSLYAPGALNDTTSWDNISVRELPGNHAYQSVSSTSRPVLSARVNQYLATETLATQNVTTLAAQYRLSFEGTGTITLSGTATGVYSAGSHLITCTAGTLTSTVSGSVTKADLRVANTGAGLPAYQRVNTATDYDTAGFPHYLRFDGVDDWMVTNTITPGIDKAQVFAGVRKLSDAARAVLIEFGNAPTQGFIRIQAPRAAAENNYEFVTAGTTARDALASTLIAPITNVLTGIGDISGDSAILRVNGTQAASSTSDQGTGNYLAYPLYIGRRGGTTLPFNGHLYSLIVRFGANLEESKITEVEKYLNYKTLAFDYRDVTDSSSFRWNSATASPDAE